MASTSSALVALLVASCTAMAAATTYTVGDSQGWTTNVNYDNWASGKVFMVSDQLVFNYARDQHTVTEVSRSGFDSCSGSNAINNDNSGSTTVTLSAPGPRYFICNIPGHCAAGMKIAVNVAGGGSTGGGFGPSGAARGALAPAVGSVVAATAAAVIKLALL